MRIRKFCQTGLLLGAIFTFPGLAQIPSGLTVKAATNKRVDLSWTGTSSSYTIQRRVLGGSYTNVATAAAGSYSDTAIDAYTAYQYQVVANLAAGASSPSNQVTVGPPPAGFTSAAPAPGPADSYIAGNYGYNLSLTLDGNGDPAFAFIFYDPNTDTDPVDTRIEFRSWNRALYQWNPVAHAILNVGDVATTFHASISLAYDQSTGVFGIASETDNGPVVLYDFRRWRRHVDQESHRLIRDQQSGFTLAGTCQWQRLPGLRRQFQGAEIRNRQAKRRSGNVDHEERAL